MNKAKKLISLLMAVVLCIGLCSGVVLADGETEAGETDTLNILALGDSITAGYGLADVDTQCFTALLAAATGATVTNEGVSGQTSTELLAAIAAGNHTTEIAQADIVTITIGGNDLMAAFYQIVADTCNSNASILAYFQMLGISTPITSEDVKAALADPSSTLGQLLLGTLTSTDLSSSLASSTVFSDAVTACITNIVSITTAIKTVNSDAVVIIANQYNPYQWLGVDTINSLFNTAVTAYNTAFAQYASVGGYLVADVYSAFSAYTTTLTNADYATSNFDFHPNAEGHAVIAQTMAAVYTAYLAEEEESQAQADLEALIASAIQQFDAAITAAQALNESDYTAESWAVLQAALASAQAVLTDLQTNGANTSLTTTEITAAYLALTNAVSSLVAEEESTTTGDGEEESTTVTEDDAEALVAAAIAQLEAAIAQVEALEESDYAAEDWAAIQAALGNAQAVLTDLLANGAETSLSTTEILAVYQTLATLLAETETETASEEDSSTTASEEDDTDATGDEDSTNEAEEDTTAEEEATTAAATSTDGTEATTASSNSSVAGTGDVSTWIYFVLLIGAASGAVLVARKKEA